MGQVVTEEISKLNIAAQFDEPPFHHEIVEEMFNYKSVAAKKGPVQLIQRVKIAHSFLQSVSNLFFANSIPDMLVIFFFENGASKYLKLPFYALKSLRIPINCVMPMVLLLKFSMTNWLSMTN